MHIRRFLTTSHQRQRLVLWALTMLGWIAAVLSGRHTHARHMRQRGDVSLDYLTRLTINLLIVRAAELKGRRPSGRCIYVKRGRDLRRRHLIRSLLGARLRRVLTYKGGASTRIQNLIQVLRRLDQHARLLFRRPLTRLFPRTPTPKSVTARPLLRSIATDPFIAACDTS
jgi:hypothetical protein